LSPNNGLAVTLNSLRNISIAAMPILVVLVAAQLAPARRSNPPEHGALTAPPEVEATLKRACYDCHSNQTRWPWYSRISPVSWLMVRDVELGRKQINFSEWGSYYPATRRRKLQWMGRALRHENMPPWYYRALHPGVALTDRDRANLEQWIDSALTTSSTQTSTK
jgi:hypothetical protein